MQELALGSRDNHGVTREGVMPDTARHLPIRASLDKVHDSLSFPKVKKLERKQRFFFFSGIPVPFLAQTSGPLFPLLQGRDTVTEDG